MRKLAKNDSAIEFIATDYLDNTIELSDYKGKKILLSFFRGASCPFCNLRIHQLIQRFSEFEERNIQTITLFAATKEEIANYAGKQQSPFPIIADPNLELYKKYGIEESPLGMIRAMMNPFRMLKVMFSGFFNVRSIQDRSIIPADFLIDESQKIHKAYYGKNFGDHLAIQEILEWNE